LARVIIIGAGLTGLAFSQLLLHRQTELKSGLDLQVLEASSTAGGWLNTQTQGPYHLESGPPFLFGNDELTTSLLQRLPLPEAPTGLNPSGWQGYATHQGQLVAVPQSAGTLLTSPLISARSRLRLLAEPLVPARPAASTGDEPLETFLSRRLGEDAGHKLADAIATLLSQGAAHHLSAESSAGPLVRLERNAGSLLQGVLKDRGERSNPRPTPLPRLLTFPHGMTTLVRALEQALGSRLQTHSPVATIQRPAPHSQAFEVTLRSGKRLEADAVVLCTPAWASAGLIHALDPSLSGILKEIPFTSVYQAHFAFRREDVKHPLDGPGFVALAGEGLATRLCLFETTLAPARAPAGEVLLRVFAGGEGRAPLPDSADQILRLLLKELCSLLTITAPPRFQFLQHLEKAFPQYSVGHPARLTRLSQRLVLHPGLFLTGSSYRGIGVSRVMQDVNSSANRLMEMLRGQEQL